MIQDLKEKKDKSDKDFDGIKKEFSKAWVNDPEVILRQSADQSVEEKDITNTVMRDVAFLKFNKDDWTFKTQDFIKALQKDPKYANLSPEDTAKQLIDQEADDDTIQDMAFIASEIMPTTESFVDLMSDKWYIDTDLIEMTYGAYLENIWDLNNADYTKVEELIDALKSYGVSKRDIKKFENKYYK
jgi:hypothetical protein